MSRHKAEIHATGIRSIGRGGESVRLYSVADQGPATVVGRNVAMFLTDQDISFILSTLAQMPAYRHVFKVIASELDGREIIANDTTETPVRRGEMTLTSLLTGQIIRDLVTHTLYMTRNGG